MINYLLSIYGVTFSQGFTYGGVEFKTMYAEVNARNLYIPAITVSLSAIIVALFPALKAARITPAKSMRTHKAQDAGYKIQDAGFKIQDSRFRFRNALKSAAEPAFP